MSKFLENKNLYRMINFIYHVKHPAGDLRFEERRKQKNTRQHILSPSPEREIIRSFAGLEKAVRNNPAP